MKSITSLFIPVFLLCFGTLSAQNEIDAFKYSQTELSGTARYMGMAGAFGSLGGDISSMYTNPAGLGIYRSSEVVTTLSLSTVKSNTNLNGSFANASKTKFNFDNIGYVGYFPTGNDTGLKSWNIGFSYNRLKNYNRNYQVRGAQKYSLAEYVADKTFGINVKDLTFVENSYDPYNNSGLNGNWLSILGYESGYFQPFDKNNPNQDEYHSSFGKSNSAGDWEPESPKSSNLTVNEKGSIAQYDFAFSTNISDRVFVGATIALTDMDYSMRSYYSEQFGGKDNLTLDNALSTDGTGYSFNLGIIARPADFLRMGVAYNSPTWYKMTDYFHGVGSSHVTSYTDKPEFSNETPKDAYAKYQLRTPDRWIFSLSGFIGQIALVSVDYELTNYKNMRLYYDDGVEREDNIFIKEDFGISHMLKAGTEIKVTPQLSVRAGYAWQSSPMNVNLKDGEVEILPAGTVTHYNVDMNTSYYTVGLGYRFTPNFYVDLACVYKEQKEDAYAFSKTFLDDGSIAIDSDPASLKNKTTKVALTLGYKF